jgi:phosphotransferase system enzyme I (PtsI)
MTVFSDIEIQLKGVSISDGIAIGNLFILEGTESQNIPRFSISNREVDYEIQRYRKAISSSKEDLFRLQDSLAQEGSIEAVTIIDAHIQMLQDPYMTTMMEDRIQQMLYNTECVFEMAMQEYEKQFERVESAFFKQRLTDVRDLSSRILKHLSPHSRPSFQTLPADSIIVSRELCLSDTAEAPKSKVKAFLSQLGSHTSHSALIARAKGIPYVASIDLSIFSSCQNKKVIVDGGAGIVIISPSEQTLKKYALKIEDERAKIVKMAQATSPKSITKDGYKIDVMANIEHIEDVHLFREHKADGVGLFRSEYLLFDQNTQDFSEESQYMAYKKLFEKTKNFPIYFRVFDVGADKQLFKGMTKETNPALGCRSIRFLLRHRDLFKVQLRAVLRAAVNANLYLLLPLISDVSELCEVRRFIDVVINDLRATGYRIKEDLQVGSMIEVPSAVMMSDFLCKECDFLSVGTNDLIQYTLAVDRGNPSIADIYQPSHPSIVRMLSIVAQNAAANDTPLSICGEMASNPLFTGLLLGLGIHQLSCSPRYIPMIKQTISQTYMKNAEQLAAKALKLGTSHEVHQLLSDYYTKLKG